MIFSFHFTITIISIIIIIIVIIIIIIIITSALVYFSFCFYALNIVIGIELVVSLTQPRSQDLSSLHPRRSEGRKTLLQAGYVPPKKWEVKKKLGEGEVIKSQFWLSITHYGRGKFV